MLQGGEDINVVPALPLGFSLARMDFDLRGACARCSANL
jgi:hypothetical protein